VFHPRNVLSGAPGVIGLSVIQKPKISAEQYWVGNWLKMPPGVAVLNHKPKVAESVGFPSTPEGTGLK
jgi:hypothetical protein